MGYNLVILNRAQEEIDQAYEYYSEISYSVMKSFDEQLELAYQSLEINPFFQFRYKNLRAIPFKSFPYILFFTIDEEEKLVYIYSVFNTNQDPQKYPNL
ncbi:type II toxin-antitoxin system RelE/ParE family toxin [Chryseobacterium gotjawalense]|uniref:Type II toxin-antitoxin system RelE/ParE family toxin n=1 Tax=Chryseobacterium gotjawalense TaxID=3042315 RepID=A0ABY8RBR4_9FLAO|nr:MULTISPECIES: type II toxin-antitoxin system RelE/ParE family toxin [unclassified Chryseobacterium]MDQ0478104.1 plasmid stabilization system protein ParE [Chryseobacterium sp. MDT2-18]WHF51405.1 type II toxin-antitoxin system RelE/ParE family toxin [Chryseobacterium sp. wdc7]